MSTNSLGRRDEHTVKAVAVGHDGEHERGCTETNDDEHLSEAFGAVFGEREINLGCVGGRNLSLLVREKHDDAQDEELEVRRQVPSLLQALHVKIIGGLISLITSPAHRFADADVIIYEQKVRPRVHSTEVLFRLGNTSPYRTVA